jgi:hypothetical protein
MGYVTAAMATEASTRGPAGMLGKSLVTIKYLAGDVLLSIEGQQAFMGLPTDGVDVHHLAQTVNGLLGLAMRSMAFG